MQVKNLTTTNEYKMTPMYNPAL